MTIGLVLSGGGAKGAYQAGIVRALAEQGIEPGFISGASIGSLNGAVIAASSNMQQASDRLHNVWLELANDDPLQFDYPRYLTLMITMGLSGLLTRLQNIADYLGNGTLANAGLYCDEGLASMLQRYLAPGALDNGTPLYVSLFEHRGVLDSLLNFLQGDVLKRVDTRPSEFTLIQALAAQDQYQALLASAAIPVAFGSKKIAGKQYSDGGQGGYRTAQGNTPITPLLAPQLGEKLDLILVSHLEDGSLWDVNDFADETILELRPRQRISENGISDMLGFSADNIRRLLQAGYDDTLATLAKVEGIAGPRRRLQQSSQALAQHPDSVLSQGTADAMAALRRK